MKYTNLAVSTYLRDTLKVDRLGSLHTLAISTSCHSFVDCPGDNVSESFVIDSKSMPSVAQGNPNSSRLIKLESPYNSWSEGSISLGIEIWMGSCCECPNDYKMKIPIKPKVDEEPMEKDESKNAF